MKPIAATVIYALLIFVLGLTKMHATAQAVLSVVALWLLHRLMRD